MGITDIIKDSPTIFSIIKKYVSIKFFNSKPFIYGSADIINVCNLHCSHCYWWKTRRNEKDELGPEDWRKIIKQTFKKHRVYAVTLVGGEPMMRPEVIRAFCDEMPRRVCVVTNGTYPLQRFDNLYFYWISLDGTERIHDSIRGKGAYSKTKKNILEYINGPPRNGKPTWKDIWITMTINSLNHSTVEDLVDEWKDIANKIGFQFHTPFSDNDPLWLPYGDTRNKVVDNLTRLRKKYPDFVMNTESQLGLMKGRWGGIKTSPVECPSWAILSLDHKGKVKRPCCIGSSDAKAMKPICEKCGLGCYSILVAQGIKN
ncbi:MAG: radical SAM protein [Thermoproteota archaeon]|nr:radical SAM protein [Thermoproteota archaeon]